METIYLIVISSVMTHRNKLTMETLEQGVKYVKKDS